MNTRYTIGLDYGTNWVRALIVNTASGEEVASGIWAYEHGQDGVILARDPNLARQHPADYLQGAQEAIGRRCARRGDRSKGSPRNTSPGSGGHDRQHADAGGWKREAACVGSQIREERCGDGLVVERPHGRGGGGGDHGVGETGETRVCGAVRGVYSSEWFSARYSAVCAQTRRSSMPPIRGWNWPTTAGGAHRHRGSGQAQRRDLRRGPQGNVQSAGWAAYPDAAFYPGCTRSWENFGDDFAPGCGRWPSRPAA